MEVNREFHTPITLPLWKEIPLYIEQKAGWVPEPVWKRWRRGNFSAPVENRTPVVQPVA